MNDRFTIHVTIADRRYPLHNVKREDEALMRNAADMVNETLALFREKMKGGDYDFQQFLEMAAFDIALKFLRLKENRDVDTFSGTLNELDKKLGDYLKNR